MRPPSSLSGSICHLPPAQGGTATKVGVSLGINYRLIPPSLCSWMLGLSRLLAVPFGYHLYLKYGYHVARSLHEKALIAHRRPRRAPPQIVFGAERLRLPVFLRRPAAFRIGRRIRVQRLGGPQELASHACPCRRCGSARMGTVSHPRALVRRAIRGGQDGALPGLRRATRPSSNEGRSACAQRRRGSHHRDRKSTRLNSSHANIS